MDLTNKQSLEMLETFQYLMDIPDVVPHEVPKAIGKAIDALRVMDNLIKSYEELTEKITNSGDISDATKRVDDWCIEQLRGIIGNYYADAIIKEHAKKNSDIEGKLKLQTDRDKCYYAKGEEDGEWMVAKPEKKLIYYDSVSTIKEDDDLTTSICSLPKIQSSDGQDYVQLYDVLETVRGYLGDCISKTEAIKTIQQHGVGCFDADDFTPEQCERYVIKLLQDLKPSVAIPNKVGHLENVDTTKSICSICGVVFSITVPEEYNDREVSHCPFCGCPMEIER